ncbi:hypothetical protein [Cupriavidus basilensis]|uniref:hypothetical protein n=1 Tax=Cupriavidus basilensis TaxID=68895 RepID=UPI0009D96220|nr:hypothetical protein [Cupriavidus basilensis]
MTQSNDAALVLYELRQGVAIATLNRPPQNRLNRPLYAELEASLCLTESNSANRKSRRRCARQRSLPGKFESFEVGASDDRVRRMRRSQIRLETPFSGEERPFISCNWQASIRASAALRHRSPRR